MDDEIDIAYTMHYFDSMNIIWDDEKNKRLMAERFISFEEITGLLLSKSYLDIIENPSRDGQMCRPRYGGRK